MKKLKFLLICLLCLPVIVKADMGPPETKQYELVVTNPDGIDYYKDEEGNPVAGHIKKDEVITVTWEYEGEYHIELKNGNYGIIKSVSGTSLIKDEIDPTKEKTEDIFKSDTEQEAIVYANEGVDLYKGPSSVYEKVAHVKKGTKLKYYYSVGDTTYIYTEYNGKKGWAEILDEKILISTKEDYIAKSDIKTSCGTISKNKVVRIDYKTDNWSGKGLVNFDNCETLVSIFKSNELLPVIKNYATTKSNLKIYEYFDDKGKELGTIPSGSKIIYIASSFQIQDETEKRDMYVEYNNIRGWIKALGKDYDFSDEELKNNNILDEISDKEQPSEEKKEDIKEEPEVISNNKKTDKADDYVLICVIVGASVAVSSLITIIIMNNKNKKKNPTEINQDEVKKDI